MWVTMSHVQEVAELGCEPNCLAQICALHHQAMGICSPDLPPVQLY